MCYSGCMSVYFIQEDTGPAGLVKIGYTQSGRGSRIPSLQTGNGRPLVLRAQFEGAAIGMESMLHEFFQKSRVCGEWFVVTDQLKKLMYWCQAHPSAGIGHVEIYLGIKARSSFRGGRKPTRAQRRDRREQRLREELDGGDIVESRLNSVTNQKPRICPMCEDDIVVGDEMLETNMYDEFVHADCVPADKYKAWTEGLSRE